MLSNTSATIAILLLFSTSSYALEDAELIELQTRASSGDAKAQYEMCTRSGATGDYGDRKNRKEWLLKAFKWCKKAADQGLADAQWRMGWIFNQGYGVNRDFSKAFEWHKKAAEQGNLLSQIDLGKMYFGGIGVDKDPIKAVHWWRKAAEQGDGEAQYILGYIYQNGAGSVKQDPFKASEWYGKACDNEHKKSCYLFSKFKWFSKKAKHGDSQAQFELGGAYLFGYTEEVDGIKGIEWLTKAAKQGHAEAQYYLGLAYDKGIEIEKDHIKAKEWYKKSCDNKFKEACEGLANL